MPIIDNTLLIDQGLYSVCGKFFSPETEKQYPPNLEIEPTHLELRLRLDLEAQTLDGQVMITILANQVQTQSISLHAVDFANVVVEDTGGQPIQWNYNGEAIQVRWDNAFKKGEKRVLKISYTVEKPSTGLFFMKPHPPYEDKALYAATDHETERARHWLPCIDLPNVRTTLDFHITAADSLTILANGSLVEEISHADGTKTAHWELKHRCPSYLVCFAVGDFTRCDDGQFENIPLAYFSSKDFSAADLKRSFGRTQSMLAWMTKKLGVEFPFPKYFQFALPGFEGAMENISLVSWNDKFVLTERLAREWTWIVDQINVHEMAHSYFGDMVVCRDFAHVWLKESWATYMESCWLEDSHGVDEQYYDLFRNAQAYFKEADEEYLRPMVTRSFDSSWQMYDQHLYPGGACRLHTLRQELGNDVFWQAITDYLISFRGLVVETDDFRKIMEKHSGRSLGKFFDQWFHTAAYPSIKVTFSYDKEAQLGTFEVEQTQADAKKNVPVFEMSTELGWTIAGEHKSLSIKLDKARQSFTIPMASEPEQVRFDPNSRVLHKLDFKPDDKKLSQQMTDAPDVVGRIQAAKNLAEAGKRANIRAIVDAWRQETFWGVRREMIRALEKSQTETALLGLIEIVDQETDAMVLDRVFESVATYRDQRMTDAILSRLERKDLPLIATACSYVALGRQREKAPLDFLCNMAKKFDKPYGLEQKAAFQAIGLSRQEAAVGFLLEHAEFGRAPYRARSGAVDGLGQICYYLDPKNKLLVEEKLIDLLRDPEPWIRTAAAKSLKNGRVVTAIDTLESYRNTLSHQEKVDVDDILRSLRKTEEPKVIALEQQLEEFQTKFRKLQDRVQDLEDK